MKVFACLIHALEQARNAVPSWSRRLVLVIAVGLALATFGHLPLMALGVDLEAWHGFVTGMCGPFCHQDPGRSFQWAGVVFPLCARCTGMWLGITLGVAFAMEYRPKHRWSYGIGMTAVFLAASAYDYFREESGGTPNAWARAIFGFFLFLGFTLAISFDILAILVASLRKLGRLHRGH
ncbi:MAG TPA: DUF2085 domain-containing protein [Polyangiaceae bacterium]|nr:DUF2085 domain-containing protein [Polyangiaceae bacterium]HNZ20727.1 DUF2085 domain-containing protein [Polyangiaceae bacterium]HOD20658.1 DUF2085 domain-containing protein [Polyangiaceae bacterium]HOE49144.1 DUF2085 domain-containing protein [Polyangiaceae bacterium]HOG99257.1 DUF2085 domain-containing protein [Polyangiaceae bacterium]